MVQKLNPKAIPWDKIPVEDLELLAEKIVESFIKRFGPETTLGTLHAAIQYQTSVTQQPNQGDSP